MFLFFGVSIAFAISY